MIIMGLQEIQRCHPKRFGCHAKILMSEINGWLESNLLINEIKAISGNLLLITNPNDDLLKINTK